MAGSYLRVELKAAKHKFTRFLLDVATQWGSTLAMMRRFIDSHEEVDKAVRRLKADGVKFTQLQPGLGPTSAELYTLTKCVAALTSVEQATA